MKRCGQALVLVCLSLGCVGTEETVATSGAAGSEDSGEAGECTPGLLACACVEDACVEGLSCVEGMCEAPSCGNGILEHFEACDDGNADNSDACTDSCTLAACGDGHVQGEELCDDGNTSYGDACNTTCSGVGLAWQKSFELGPDAREFLLDLTTDAEGNIYGVGQQNEIAAAGRSMGLVTKFDGEGELLWLFESVSPNEEHLRWFSAIAQDSAARVYAVGAERDAEGLWRPLVVQLDAEGELLWEQTFDEQLGLSAIDALVEADDSLVLAGSVGAEFAPQPGFMIAYAGEDHSELWSRAYAGSMRHVVGLPGGEYGVLQGTGSDAELVRLDTAGEQLWSVALPGSASQVWEDLGADAEGGMVAAGWRIGGASFDDPVVAAFAPDGSLRWSSRGLPLNLGGRAVDLALGQDGSVFSVGRVTLSGHTEYPLLQGFSPAGESLWNDYNLGSVFGELTAVTVDGEGRIIFAGITPPMWETAESDLLLVKYY